MRFSTLLHRATALISLLTFLGPVAADWDVNCKGSHWCGHLLIRGDPIHRFYDLLKTGLPDLPGGPVPNDTYFHAGSTIACQPGGRHGHLCMFLEGNHLPYQGLNASSLATALVEMYSWGCRVCGSVGMSPFAMDRSDARRETGRLVLNMVSSMSGQVCDGLCEWHGPTEHSEPFKDVWPDCTKGVMHGECLPTIEKAPPKRVPKGNWTMKVKP